MSKGLTDAWYRGHVLLWLLWPLSLLYRAVTAVRRWLFRLGLMRTRRFPVPVVVVGNVAVGGTGKTPLTLALIERLRAEGFRPGVVSRGYGGETTYPALVTAASTSAAVGDEPLLLALRSGAPVVVDPQRPRAVQKLLDETNCDVVLCDDGMQHYALARDIEICVIDGQRGLGNRQLLPMGPLREPPWRLKTVEYVVGNGGTAGIPGVFGMHLRASTWRPLDDGDAAAPKPGARIRAIAGIGNPGRFFGMLRAQGYEVVEQAFPDHHRYTAQDLSFVDGLPLVMTEKDAVKCRALGLHQAWYVPVTAELPEQFYEALVTDLRRLRVRRYAR